jgi:hypothetical protein
MKQQTPEQAVVATALDAARRYRAGRWDIEGWDDLPALFDALDVLFAALSKTKQRHLRPPKPKKRGRKTTAHAYTIGQLLARFEREGKQWRDAIEETRCELVANSLEFPSNANDKTLRRWREDYKSGKLRPYLLKHRRKIRP